MIKDVVAPLLEEFRETMASKGVTLSNELPASIALKADRDLLQVVYKNLIDNALKYGRKGGTIKLTFASTTETLEFGVWNEGENLSEEQLAQVFDKFVRLRREQGLAQGTGLGLFITKEIIHKHGGDIWARCEQDKWVQFIFTLPIRPLESTDQ
jgi:two-component system sensor histidine kinase VicK